MINAPNPSNDVHGLLKGVSLSNFLQLIEIGGDTCLLEVRCDRSDEIGLLYINEGVLFDATCGASSDTEAAVKMLKWDRVEIRIQELPDENIPKKIEKSLASLIILVQGEDDAPENDAPEDDAPAGRVDNLKKLQTDEEPGNSNELKKVLEKMAHEMDGLIASAIVSIEDGLQIEQVSNKADFNSASASAYLARSVKSNQEALKLLGWNRRPEDILITTDDCYFIIRQLPGNAYFLFVLTARDEWIGRTRYMMAEYAEKIAEKLELIQKK